MLLAAPLSFAGRPRALTGVDFKDNFFNCFEIINIINFLTVSVVNKIWRKVREKFLLNFLKTPLIFGFIRALSVLHCETESHRIQLNCKRQDIFSEYLNV